MLAAVPVSTLWSVEVSDNLGSGLVFVVAAVLFGVLLGWRLARTFTVPFDADRYFPLTEPNEVLLRGALQMCNQIRDHTTRCYFKGRIREMVRLQPICDASEFGKMSKDLHAEVDDCLHFGTCFRYAGPAVRWDTSRLPSGPLSLRAGAEMAIGVKRMHRVLCGMAKRYGKLFPMQMDGNPLWVVVSGAKEAKAVFHDNGLTMSSRTFGQSHLVTHTDFPAGNFLRCPFSEDLKKRRGVVWREALSRQKVEFFRPCLDKCRHLSIRAFLLASEEGSSFNPRPFLRMTYLNTLACILFDVSFDDVNDPEYQRVYEFVDDEANEPLLGEADIVPLLRFTPLYTRKTDRMKRIRARQDAWLTEKIGSRQQHLAEGGEVQTLCDILLQTMDSPCPGQRLSYENIKEICNEIIFAGTDTTATTTETVLAHLLNNPDKAKTLRAELDDVFCSLGRMPSPAEFSKLRYTNAVIKEAMRMTCAVPFNSHTCTADTEVLGYRIPKGAMCINNIYAVHYDPEIYPDPERFLPERWLDKDPCTWAVENNFEFMPFGIGRRLCLGYNLALENLQLFVASLFWSFEFSSADGKPVSMAEEVDFTISIPDFKVRAEVRESTALGLDRKHYRDLPSQPQSAKMVEVHVPKIEAEKTYRDCPSPQVVVPSERWAVWYASQTGTGEGFAHALASAARQRGAECSVRNLESAAGASLAELCPGGESKAVFIASTFGNGEPTDSAVDFYRHLMAAQVAAADGLQYAVFGLGNSSYEHFNAAALQLDARLAELGGKHVEGVPVGLGDASKDLDGAFDEWMAALLDSVLPAANSRLEVVSADSTGEALQKRSCETSWQVVWQPEVKSKLDIAPQPRKLTRRKTRISELAHSSISATVQGVTELAKQPSISGSIAEVTLDLHGETYNTADTVGIFPTNDIECVELFGALLNQPLDSTFTMAPTSEGAVQDELFPCPTTLREVLSNYVDIIGKPSRRVITKLASFCSDSAERQELLALASPAGKSRWEELARCKRLSLLELFVSFPSLAAVPLANFLELVPQMRLKPRYYTASSCPEAMGDSRVTLTVKVLRDRVLELPGGRHQTTLGGVSSSFLATALAGQAVRVFVQPSGFGLPPDPAVPILMVAAGTGIAPFRGFLQERSVLAEGGTELGEASLFFGCTRRDADFICEDELAAHRASGALTELVPAFSREDPGRKVYVQHRLVEHAALVSRTVEGGGHVYVCGSTSMGNAVKEAIIGILASGRTLPEARAMLAKLEQERRYVSELWA
mmetsp:Transcript_102038/g.264251  ORF Transcript_102038/g.264251 Transcript_102038/m.264251 type:complete len:1267 (+) Transcript_102038:55-3855(+)